VAVVGRPNVGKSTLMNSLLGQKIAAVTPRPQTTRKQQLGILTLDEAQIIFTDTPGIHKPRHKLGERMNEEALAALADADLIMFLVDISVSPQEEDTLIVERIKEFDRNKPILLVLNKVDLITPELVSTRREEYMALLPQAVGICLSALSPQDLPELIDLILKRLPVHPPFYPPDQITDAYERDIAADLIREAALLILRDEIPHGIAVRMDQFTERGDQGAYIEATIFVERESQKGIVIGKNGEMIKQISTHARHEIEKMSGRSVFLRLKVKVRKNWRNDENTLRNFGFQ
jgi:GTP-binding protein Era